MRIPSFFLIALLMVIFANTKSTFSADSTQVIYPNTSEKLNERGFLKSNKSMLKGSEIIGEYDGNVSLLFNSPINLPNNLETGITLTLNTNTSHKVYISGITNKTGYSLNSPEWIIGAFGFALQTLNFEGNYYSNTANNGVQNLIGENISQLIPGYHICNKRGNWSNGGGTESSEIYDYIDILTSDGGSIHLVNTEQHATHGAYISSELATHTFAMVYEDPSRLNLRKIFLQKGDGLVYYFEEDTIVFHDYKYVGNDQTIPKTVYLKQITSPYGDTISFHYADSLPWCDKYKGISRRVFTHAKINLPIAQYYNNKFYNQVLFGIDYNLDLTTYYVKLPSLRICNYLTGKDNFVELTDKSNHGLLTNQRDGDSTSTRILGVKKIYEPGWEPTEISYRPIYRRYYSDGPNFSLTQVNYLPDTIKYYDGTKSILKYSNPQIVGYNLNFGPSSFAVPLLYSNYSNLSFLQSSFRDDYANFMLSSRKIIERQGAQESVKQIEKYEYLWDRDSYSDSLRYVNNIITKKTIQAEESQDSVSISTYFIKKAPKDIPFHADYTLFSVKPYQVVVDDGQQQRFSKTEYSDTTFWVNATTDSIHFRSNYLSFVKKKRYYYISHEAFLPRIILKDAMKVVESDGITTETIYNHFYSAESDYLFNPNLIFIPELPCTVKTFSENLLQDHTITEYFGDGLSVGKISKITTFPESRPVTNCYQYYDYTNNWVYRGLRSSDSCSNGVLQKLQYPALSAVKIHYTVGGISQTDTIKSSLRDSVEAKVLMVDGTVDTVKKVIAGYQTEPSIKMIMRADTPDTVTIYTALNSDGNPDFQIDENKNFTEYGYDPYGRLLYVNLPGSFLPHNNIDTVGYILQDADILKSSRNFVGISESNLVGYSNLKTQCFNNDPMFWDHTSNHQANRIFNPDASNGGIGTDELVGGGNGAGGIRPNEYYFSYFAKPIPCGTAVSVDSAYFRFKTNRLDSDQLSYSGTTVGILPILQHISGDSVTTLGSMKRLTFEFLPDHEFEIRIDSILIYCAENNYNLIGFVFGAYLPNNRSDRSKCFYFSIHPDSLPSMSYSFKYRMQERNEHARSSITNIYNDKTNQVLTKRRMTYSGLPEDAVSYLSTLNSSGKVLTTDLLKTGGTSIRQATNQYNYLDLAVSQSDAMQRNVFNQYNYFTEPTEIRYENNSAQADKKQISYNLEPVPGESGAGAYKVTKVIDEVGNETITYVDTRGLKMAELKGKGTVLLNTKFMYDELRRLSTVISPEGKLWTYEYDDLGNLRKRVTPDDGANWSFFDKYKRLRFSVHDDEEIGGSKIEFNGYDMLNRLVYHGITEPIKVIWQTGLNPDSVHNVTINDLPDFENPERAGEYYLSANLYDKFSPAGVFAGMDTSVFSRIPVQYREYKGRLAATAFRDKVTEEWNYKVYGYNALGQVTDYWIKFAGREWKGIRTEYNAMGSITKQSVSSVNSSIYSLDEMYWWYTYDDEGRLKAVYSNIHDAFTTARKDMQYTYNKAGQDSIIHYTATEIQAQLVKSYNSRGRLSSISLPYKFNQSLVYHGNGNISGLSSGLYINTITWGSNYSCNYDEFNRLTNIADAGHQLESYTYDGDGNILTKHTQNGELVYSYVREKNQLASIRFGLDDSKMFSYDNAGNMIWHEQRGLSILEYNAENLPLSVTTANSTTEYRYDESGNRISKETGGKKELYLRDQTGRELATYICVADGKDSVTTFNLYANGNIGKIEVKYSESGIVNRGNPTYEMVRTDAVYYYVHDYLGSIAATLDNRGEFVFAEQVYPYGEVKLKYEAGTATQQRFDFTGKERDSETGLHYYGARYYDSKLGIWLSVDPLLDKYPGLSPYNYCLNNPINAVDPDGRDVWEKIKNFVSGKGWRDDTFEENHRQRDWENFTPQLALKYGVNSTTYVTYSDDVNIDGKHPGHYTMPHPEENRNEIVMTKGGYEKLDENNLYNTESSFGHEKSHASQNPAVLAKLSNKKEKAREEIRAVKAQKKMKNYGRTTESYKRKVERFLKVQEKIIRGKK